MRSYEVRELVLEEMPTAVALWVSVFGVEERFFTSLLDADARGGDRSYGVFDSGQLVSSVHVFEREIRLRDLEPVKVGCIGSVSTLPDHRKLGYSGMLLEAAIAGMEEMGCVWSFLGTGVNDHYARYGWRTISTPSVSGSPRAIAEMQGEVLPLSDHTLQEMAPLWELTSMRPQAMLRPMQMWRSATHYRLGREGAEILGYRRDGKLTAYLATWRHEHGTTLVDAGWMPDAREDAEALVHTAAGRAHADGKARISFHLPQEGGLFEAFQAACSGLRPREDRAWMVRPVADRIGWADLAALHADPRGRRCELDDF